MRNASPHQITDVQKAVHAAEIHEDAVVGDVFHFAGDDGAFGERGHQRVALAISALLRGWRGGETTTLPRLRFSFRTRTSMSLSFQPSRSCTGRNSICEAGRKERTPMSTTRAAFDALGDFAGDGGMFAIGFFDAFPDAAAMRADVGEQNVAVFLGM